MAKKNGMDTACTASGAKVAVVAWKMLNGACRAAPNAKANAAPAPGSECCSLNPKACVISRVHCDIGCSPWPFMSSYVQALYA